MANRRNRSSRYIGPREIPIDPSCLWDLDAQDQRIMRSALTRAKKYPAEFSKFVRGLRCVLCLSRNTKTEFYRLPPGKAKFGVCACNNCGAC